MNTPNTTNSDSISGNQLEMMIPVSEVSEEEILTPDEQFRGKRGVDRLTKEEVKEYFKDFLPIPKS